jgi:hypothetical protein
MSVGIGGPLASLKKYSATRQTDPALLARLGSSLPVTLTVCSQFVRGDQPADPT